ncbi:hypothetical protein pipiens_001234 [Culex pipiens pipiens]|uniref:Uncharacterized protein n=1 Tax=Culex pipiens pipiens TaxID=38569 RepID=A0ABD1DBL9_CULPP
MPRKRHAPPAAIPLIHLVRASWLHQVGQFFTESTLHGVRYIAEAGRPFWEHFAWFCLVLVSAVTTVCIILNLWVRFQTHPTITGPDTSLRFTATVFPTVLVCPVETPFDEEKLGSFNETLLAMSSFGRIGQLVGDRGLVGSLAKVKIDDVRSEIFRSVLSCDEVIGECWFRGTRLEDCCKSFLPVFSEVGFCYAFSAKFYDTERAWVRNPDRKFIYETDKKWGLTFGPLRKSNILIHSYNELSGWEFRPQVQWDEDFAIELLVTMKQTYTTEDARQLSIGQRKCIFPDEVGLQYHEDEYTYSGCMRECRLVKSLKRCGCVPPFYALKPESTERQCGPADLPCLVRNFTIITRVGRLCQQCELGCNNTVYEIEKYSKVVASEAGKEPLVTIEYLTWPVIRYKREVLFGWVDLLVSFGGIAGLFLGFSLLSGVEIIYFFTMRACCMLYKNRDQLVAIEQEKLHRPPDRFDLNLLPALRRRNRKQPTSPDPSQRNVITLSLVEQEFNAVKVPKERGLVLGGLGAQPEHRRLERRLEKMKIMVRPDFFQPVHVAPYSERIKPLDRNVVRTKDGGMLYNGYLP